MALERYTRFKESTELPGPGVLDLYREAYTQLVYPRRELYVSSPLTSGGARRLFDANQTPVDVMVTDTMRLNSQFAELVADRILKDLPEIRVTLPHKIGKRPEWGEFDYNRFWLYYLGGVSPDDLVEFESAPLPTDVGLLNNHTAAREERARTYQEMLQSFLSYIFDRGLSINPVSMMALMPDYHYSLGCSTELALAQALNIPTQRIMFDCNHPDFEDLAIHASWLKMVCDGSESSTLQGNGQQLVVLK